ncbi:MAG TPA: hypothetical protein PL018_12320 [Ignavibacteriaceae bacterium]|nr:hypothetical protein [Ignavibacteriaceae bacterium]
MNVNELSRNLNSLRDGFNSKHLSITGKYSGLDKDFAEKETKRDRALIHEQTLPQLLSIKYDISPLRETLLKDRAKARLGYSSDKELQIQSAYLFLNGNPNPDKLQGAIREAMHQERRAFVGTLLNYFDSNPYSIIEAHEHEASINVIQKAKALFDELHSVAGAERDLDELSKIENRLNNFINVTREAVHCYMIFPDVKMTNQEIQNAVEYLEKNAKTFPLEQRIAMSREISQANPDYREENNMQRLPEPRWNGKGIQYTPPVEVVD